MTLSIQTSDFDIGAEIGQLRGLCPGAGALVSFVGTVRDMSGETAITHLWIEHYPGMTEKSLAAILEEARLRWPLLGVRVIHRVGALAPGDAIVLVIVASTHRGPAFEACEFIMDYLKTQAMFWKKERFPEKEVWVDARASDEEAAQRWREKFPPA
ncbi:molybdenum cofactor biosynthesis protein MoaE [Ferrovum sp.]|jgi:molybdopterin synthase catalytic subunit|uniref:molybdenum cofactor biosynthesis protein MoaE n=1 Tax=Ferrovum sp. TaxID=2609467 RepID=UPI002612D963|nr:molybdenum cofactor biosynthesis protein MoaE [Ferrovum sp.]